MIEGNVTAIGPPSAMSPRLVRPHLSFALWNRIRRGQRRSLADRRCARRQRRSRDKELITLGRSRTARHALTRKGLDVGVRCYETVRECLHEGNDLVLLRIR